MVECKNWIVNVGEVFIEHHILDSTVLRYIFLILLYVQLDVSVIYMLMKTAGDVPGVVTNSTIQ